MIEADLLFDELLKRDVNFCTGVPCSLLKPLINTAMFNPGISYAAATNEGDAVALASGVALTGAKGIVMLQNSGLGNTVNPLTSLNAVFKIPLLLFVTLRGEPGQADAPQHEWMGKITGNLLDIMQIPWEFLPSSAEKLGPILDKAIQQMSTSQFPFAFVVKKQTVYSSIDRVGDISEPTERRMVPEVVPQAITSFKHLTRKQVLTWLVENTSLEQTLLVSTTGYTSRELFALADRPNQFYMIGSMGCASSLGMGLAFRCPSKKVIVIDGDGAVLMRMGALPMVGHHKPTNLVHIILDNGMYESTGGQKTMSSTVSLGHVAAACGYTNVFVGDDFDVLEAAMAPKGPVFVHLRLEPGYPDNLPRPTLAPHELRKRFEEFVQTGKAS